MLTINLLAPLLVFLSTLLAVSARPDFRSRGVVYRSPTPTQDDVPTDVERWTNARRLAAGLSPRKPAALVTPSRILGARRPQSSSTPEKKCWIYADRVGSGSWDSYVGKDYVSGKKYFDVDDSRDDRMVVKFTPSSSGPVNLAIEDPPSYPYLGFAGETLGSSSAFYMTDTNPTSAGSTPQSVGNGLSPGTPKSESAIWSYDSSSNRFTAQWVQPNGSIVYPKFWYSPSQDTILLVRNNLSSGWEVRLYCDPYQSGR